MALQLAEQHFSAVDGRVMTLNINRPIVFVLFKMAKCGYSTQILPFFEQMAKQDQRLAFAVIDVGQYRNVTGMAKSTNTPIRSTPTFILYSDGQPKFIYKGERTPQNIKAFLDDALHRIAANRSFSQQGHPPQRGGGPPQGHYPPQGQFPQQGPHGVPQQPASDDETALKMPPNVIPINEPWRADKKAHY